MNIADPTILRKRNRPSLFHVFRPVTIILSFFIIGCSGSSRFVVPEPIPDDRRPVPQPAPKGVNIVGDIIEKQFTDQIDQSLDLSRQLRNLFGKRKQAMNVDAFDEVPNSSWFTNRNHLKRMSLDEIARGPNQGNGPDLTGSWTITDVKSEGVTPGFTIRDSQGDRYVIKFEPIGFSELSSGAEVVSTKVFHAAGYNVPENYIVYFHPDILNIGEDVMLIDERGRERAMNEDDLNRLLNRVNILPDGRIRVVASKLIAGKGLFVPFKYKGVRKDDLNDIIPHQHRRELRGLRVIAAWLNHFDTKANNSLDVYTHEEYVKHYLIDFGSTLGSNGDEPMPPEIGFENSFDPHQIFLNTITAGFYVKPWEKEWSVPYPAIGHFESQHFDPQDYKFIIPNPAFENMTDRDGYWGAKVVMSFTDDQLRAAVDQGRYTDPAAADYLITILKERRDIVGRYWFDKMTPIDHFDLKENSRGAPEICFVDLAVESGLAARETTEYQYDLKNEVEIVQQNVSIGSSPCIILPADIMIPDSGEIQWRLSVRLRRSEDGPWSKDVRLFLRQNEADGRLTLLGVKR